MCGTWADFKSLYESGRRPPGAQEFEKWHLGEFFSTTCRQRAGDHDSEKLSILMFLAHNMAIWSVPREPQRNSTHISIVFCPKRSYQVRFAKIFHFGRRRRRRRLRTTGSLARCLPLTHPGVKYPVRGYPSLRFSSLPYTTKP